MRPSFGNRRLVGRLLLMAAVVVAGSLVSVLASARTSSPSAPRPAAKQADPAPDAQAAQSRRRAVRRTYNYATTSSPIARNRSGSLVWSVNPGNDTVSVIRTRTNSVIRQIRVGDEPQSIALDPSDRYAFVANAAAGTVSVIRIRNANPSSFRAAVSRTFRTGAEPWNIVPSPDGRRVFVANSGQDTITILDARSPRIIVHVNLRLSRCNDPDRNRHFQPRGLAVTKDSNRL